MPTATPRSVSGDAGHRQREERGEHERDPGGEDRGPHDEADRARERDRQQQAGRRHDERAARQLRRADLVGQLGERQPEPDHDQGVDRQRQRRPVEADLTRVQRHEREEPRHPERSAADEHAREDGRRVEQARPDALAGPGDHGRRGLGDQDREDGPDAGECAAAAIQTAV